jgi:hypothetical protein
VGGGAASGDSVPPGTSIARPPLAARLVDGSFVEAPIDPSLFGTNDRFGDVAAVPGTSNAWVAVQPFASRSSTTGKARIALVTPSGVSEVDRLPSSGAGRGTAARIACTGPTDCWMVTTAGWLFHCTDGTTEPQNTDPAWQGTIDFRPNEAAEQFIPDAPPPDDSNIFAPPPPPPPPQKRPKPKRLPPLLKKVHVKLHGTVLTVSFRLVRRAKIGLVARQHGHLVARTRFHWMKPGKRHMRLRLDPHRWPTSLKFRTHEPGVGHSGGGTGPDTITTGGGSTGTAGGSTEPTGGGGTTIGR